MITSPSHVLARSKPLVLGCIDTSPRTARASAVAQLAQWGRAELADDLAEIVSELTTNAVQASEPGGTAVVVSLILTSASVAVEVHDRAPGFPVLREPGPGAESGRGLRIVAELSRDWGWLPTRGGKVVWSELAA